MVNCVDSRGEVWRLARARWSLAHPRRLLVSNDAAEPHDGPHRRGNWTVGVASVMRLIRHQSPNPLFLNRFPFRLLEPAQDQICVVRKNVRKRKQEPTQWLRC